MNKYISLALATATAAAIACSKVAPEDISPIESLPQDENTENIYGEPSGEKIIISLAQTKVSLDGDGFYQFDGDEVIYVKARTKGAVAKLQNSATEPNTFTGVFNDLLGDTSETFDFYYNCTDEDANVVTDEKGNVVKVQNGQPWLAAIGVKGDRDRSTASEYSYKLSDVKLNQLGGYVCLALNSGYPCTVDFHTLTTALPNGETTISGIQLGSGSKKPYFVNIVSGMTGGFYLTVTNPKGQKMYTSYGTTTTTTTTTPISSNQIIKTKEFEAFSITGQLVDDTKTTFKSTYDVYRNSGAEAANEIKSDIISSGEATFTMTGISKTIRNLVSLKNITVTFSDDVPASVGTTTPAWTETKAWTITIPETTGHNKWGPVTVKNAVAVFSTPDGNDYEVSFANPSMTRYITGLPYTAAPPTKSGSYPWKATRGVSNTDWNSGEVVLNAALTSSLASMPKIQSSDFYLPNNESINVAATVGYRLRASSSKVTTTFAMWISGVEVYKNSTSSTKEIGSDSQSINNDKCILTSSKKYIEFESYRTNILSSIADNYAKLKSVRLEYR